MDPYIGEIRLFGGSYAPMGWAFCFGQILPIQGNQALFTVIGTTYGGDGKNTFALPNMMERVPMGYGNGPGLTPRKMGDKIGSASVALTLNQIPPHTHQAAGSRASASGLPDPTGNVWGAEPPLPTAAKPYIGGAPAVAMNPAALGVTGGSAAHNNMQPYVALNFIIALEGIYPVKP